MTLTDKLRLVSATLTGVSKKIYHYRRAVNTRAPYGIWAEDQETGSAVSGNKKAEQQIHGTIDWYTLHEFDETVDQIQDALNAAGRISYRLNSIQYEDETKLIHYEWEFWVI